MFFYLSSLVVNITIISLTLYFFYHVSDIDVDELARGTTGFTGADLENMTNQAALKAAIDECTTVAMEHFDFARDKVLMGKLYCRGAR